MFNDSIPKGTEADRSPSGFSVGKNLLKRLDQNLIHLQTRLGERDSLLILTFHHLLSETDDLEQFAPHQKLYAQQFGEILARLQAAGYRFVSPDELDAISTGDRGRCAMLTFDDGYYDNHRALPFLEKHDAPMVLFVSTEPIERQQSYWWDVVYRHHRAAGSSMEAAIQELESLKHLPADEVEAFIQETCEPTAHRSEQNSARPLTSDQLAELAKHPLVHLGNHTASHAILTNYSAARVRTQITRAQTWLQECTGVTPRIIAYPNGNVSPMVIEQARACGLEWGVTVRPHKNPWHRIARGQRMELGRFMPRGDRLLQPQLERFRSDFSLRRIRHRFLPTH